MMSLNWPILTVSLLATAYAGLAALGRKRWSDSARALTSRLESNCHFEPHGRFDAAELEGLPDPVQRYFRLVLEDRQPLITTATIDMFGTFNMSTTENRWKPFTSQQRVTTSRPGFLWDARVRLFPAVPVRVFDGYIAGEGHLRAAVLGLLNVARVHGAGDIARGEYMRWFAEAAWYPTALLPSQGVRWEPIDECSAHATITDGPLVLRLLFIFDAAGLITTVRAAARGADFGKDLVMLPWECTLSNYIRQNGMLLPMYGEAAWLRTDGRRSYFRGTVRSISHEFSR